MKGKILRVAWYAVAAGLVGGLGLGAAGCGEVAGSPDAGSGTGDDGGTGSDDRDGGEGDDASTDPDARVDCDDGFTGPDCEECTVFVDGEVGDDGQVGKSWDDAVASVGAGIGRAATRRDDEELDRCSVWVREGTYLPGENRDASFELAPGTHLYGGFAGFETARDQRNIEQYETVLSGDLDQDDDPSDEGSLDDNAYHVVIGADDATLDGFTITAGNADGDVGDRDGGGMHDSDASPTLSNVSFRENKADNLGGAMFNRGSSAPTLENVSFTDNEASRGGAMFNQDDSAPTLEDVSFTDNDASRNVTSSGGAMYNEDDSAPTLESVSFTDNEAAAGGGAMFNSGSSAPTLANVVFNGNRAAGDGGAMYSQLGSAPTLANVVFNGNQATGDGGAMFIFSGAKVEIFNAILWGNEAENEGNEIHHEGDEDFVIRSSIVEGGEGAISGGGTVDAGSGDIRDENPDFVDAPEDLRLSAGSEAIDAGDESLLDDLEIELPETDLAGEPRLVDGDDSGEAVIDLGPFEFQPE